MTSLGRVSSSGISRLVSMSIKTGFDLCRIGRPPGRPRPLPRIKSLTSSPRRLGVGSIGFCVDSLELEQLPPLLTSGVAECLSKDLHSKCGFTTSGLVDVDCSVLLLE